MPCTDDGSDEAKEGNEYEIKWIKRQRQQQHKTTNKQNKNDYSVYTRAPLLYENVRSFRTVSGPFQMNFSLRIFHIISGLGEQYGLSWAILPSNIRAICTISVIYFWNRRCRCVGGSNSLYSSSSSFIHLLILSLFPLCVEVVNTALSAHTHAEHSIRRKRWLPATRK